MAKFSIDMQPSQAVLEAGRLGLEESEYPGRVIIVGRSAVGHAVEASALTGRRPSSKNREYVLDETGVTVIATDKTQEEMDADPDAPLIYYKTMSERNGAYIVSNGAQTEHVLSEYLEHGDLERAVRAAPTVATSKGEIDLSRYEPDDYHTPRITGGVLALDSVTPFGLAVVRKHPDSFEPIYSTYVGHDLGLVTPGVGFGVQTYEGGSDPSFSFSREAYAFPLGETAEEIAHDLWNVLNKDKRAAVVVRTIGLKDGTIDYHILPE